MLFRSVRLVVPVPPGGSLDVMARILSPKWGEVMGQNVIIDYRPGANTIVGSEHVARAPADGYTLLINTLPFVTNTLMYRKVPYHPNTDFAPLSPLSTAPSFLSVPEMQLIRVVFPEPFGPIRPKRSPRST